jgi:hypothetical protein
MDLVVAFTPIPDHFHSPTKENSTSSVSLLRNHLGCTQIQANILNMSHRDPNIHLTFYPNPNFTDEDQNLGGRLEKKIEAAMV